ncbi:MAG: peptide-methionine (S)-S-oxide reductase [Acidobacteria bacterium]|nr:MAG: peptide-methionine (S)-S-oxide reductase [Acidobacteriota bacterium]MCE7956788.1 peptide-methionine (S)-S-oxide reductase [Acidobacteria bacterium ACB2]
MSRTARLLVLALCLGGIALLLASGAPSAPSPPDPAPPAPGTGVRKLAKATFAGGCFWCMEPPFEKLDGVVSVVSGYTGGTKANPTYEEVGSGGTGHAEAVEVLFDPARVSYETLLDVYWRNVDPTNVRGQFCDFGEQYRPEVFVHDEAQRRAAEASRKRVEATKRFSEPVVVPITAAGPFWRAEEYHQDYYRKNPVRYRLYRAGCGRDARLVELWGAAPH